MPLVVNPALKAMFSDTVAAENADVETTVTGVTPVKPAQQLAVELVPPATLQVVLNLNFWLASAPLDPEADTANPNEVVPAAGAVHVLSGVAEARGA